MVVIVRRICRTNRCCKDGQMRNVVQAIPIWHSYDIPKEILDFERFKDWFLMSFGMGRYSIIKLKGSKENHWVGSLALFNIHYNERKREYMFFGNLEKIKRKLSGRQRRLKRLAEENLEDQMFFDEMRKSVRR